MKHTILLTSFIISCVSHFSYAEEKAILDYDTVPTGNISLLWSPVFQATWDELNNFLGGKPFKVEPPNQMIEKLNHFSWDQKAVIPSDSFAAFSGKNTASFRQELQKKFKEKLGLDWNIEQRGNDENSIIACAALSSELKFEPKFFRPQKKSLAFTDAKGSVSKVAFFGVAKEYVHNYKEQVRILHYDKTTSSFAVEILTNKEDQSVIIYQPDQTDSFSSTFSTIAKMRAAPLVVENYDERYHLLNSLDILKVPCIKLDNKTEFTEQLRGLLYIKQNKPLARITDARISYDFQLDEGGAKAITRSSIHATFGGPPPPPQPPRHFIFNKPFYVFMWKKNAQIPYFAMWVANADSLIKLENSP